MSLQLYETKVTDLSGAFVKIFFSIEIFRSEERILMKLLKNGLEE